MYQKLLKSKFVSTLFILLFTQTAFSQLAEFTLAVTPTNETCTGNGTLTLNVSGTTPGATIIYSVYLLPNTTTPVITTTTSPVTGLVAGNYRIIALQSLGSDSNTQTQDVTISNLIVPLVYQVVGTPEACGNGTIAVVVTQGNPLTYEIISGPVTVPPQASGSFTNLPAGEYNIRVNDACGEGVVQTYTIVPVNYITLSNFTLNCELVDCNTTSGNFTITAVPNQTLLYPITVSITISQPGQAAVVVNQVIASGPADVINIPVTIPYAAGQSYSYNITVTDSCGHAFVNGGSAVFQPIVIGLTGQTEVTDPNQINLSVCNYLPPYTVNFVSTPPGFNPADYNAQYPGPFTTSPLVFNSIPGNEIPDGTYDVIVTDACGLAVPGTITLGNCIIDYSVILDCDSGIVYIPNIGSPVVSVILIAATPAYPQPLPYDVSFNIEDGLFEMEFPYGTYTFLVESVCGNIAPIQIIIGSDPVVTAVGGNAVGCAMTSGFIDIATDGPPLSSIVITQAPAGFNHPLPYDVSVYILPDPTQAKVVGLMVGDYVLTVTDICGNVFTLDANVPLMISQVPPLSRILEGCDVGMASMLLVSQNSLFEQVIITAAPAAYPTALPHDVSSFISNGGAFFINGLPEGSYTIFTKDICGVEHTIMIQINGYHIVESIVDIQANCNSFNLDLRHNTGIPVYFQQFWLQRFNAVSGQWEHPLTGIVYPGGTPTETNSYLLQNGTVNYNIAALGSFRVLRTNLIYSNGSSAWTICLQTINEFEFNGELKITTAYTLPCSSGSSEVVVIANGAPPLIYRITTKDGQPFVVENGNSNVFSGLAPGIYNFQVQDLCGNIANRVFDIIGLPEPSIASANLCPGQSGQLSVQAFSFLSYQWWKGTDTTNILSTTNVLAFNPFSNTTTPGTYYVRIFSPSALSCVDRILSFVIPAVSNPNAGQDAASGICGSTAAVDLFTLLGAPYDTNGVWTEISTSGMLTGNTWLPVGVPFGIYTFKYTVNGLCSDVDEAFVTINLSGTLPQPVVSVSPEYCSGGIIGLNVANIPGANFQWTGPDNYSSNEQNPVIENASIVNNGQYTVTATNGGCETTASVTIAVIPAVDFTISNSCIDGNFMLTATAVAGSSIPSDATLIWTGPENFTSTANPITITGLSSGSYALTVTNTDGCTNTQTVDVGNTRCSAPAGISPNGDGFNDSFDLAGFDVLKLEIFSRYGRLVYEEDNYVDQWHGQDYKDRELPDATYYYYMRLKSGQERTGWVYVTK